jgi:cell division transport system permease protein
VKLSLIGLVLRQLRSSLRHSCWIHVVTAITMALTLFVFGGFMLLQANLDQMLRGWGDQMQIIAYMRRPVETGDLQRLLERVQALPEVQRVRYTSEAQAWRDFQTALGSQSGLLEGLPHDVLPASLEVTLKPALRDSRQVEQVAQRLRAEKEIDSVEYPQQWVERLGLIVLAVEWGKWIIGGVLFLATFFIVGSTVKLALFARKEEVEIMQLVGASQTLIRAPFLLEGLLQGLTGATISLAALWGAYRIIGDQLQFFGGFLSPLGELQFLDLQRTALLFAIGSLLGAAGNVFSVRRFVKTWHASDVRT